MTCPFHRSPTLLVDRFMKIACPGAAVGIEKVVRTPDHGQLGRARRPDEFLVYPKVKSYASTPGENRRLRRPLASDFYVAKVQSVGKPDTCTVLSGLPFSVSRSVPLPPRTRSTSLAWKLRLNCAARVVASSVHLLQSRPNDPSWSGPSVIVARGSGEQLVLTLSAVHASHSSMSLRHSRLAQL